MSEIDEKMVELRKKLVVALDGHTKYSRDCNLTGDYLTEQIWPVITAAALSLSRGEGERPWRTIPKEQLDAEVTRRAMAGLKEEFEAPSAIREECASAMQKALEPRAAEKKARLLLANNGRNVENHNQGIPVGSPLHLCEMLLAQLDAIRSLNAGEVPRPKENGK